MPNQTTYYSEQELAAIEAAARERDASFSAVVRAAVREHLGVERDA